MTLLVASIAAENVVELKSRAEQAWAGGADAVEVRMDTYDDDPATLAAYLKAHNDRTWIVTCRSPREGGQSSGSVTERVSLLVAAARGTNAYVDFELADWLTEGGSSNVCQRVLLASAKTDGSGHRLILSAHDLNPPRGGPANLTAAVDEMAKVHSVTAAKVAYQASHICDSFHALDLMHERGSSATSIAMGEDALWTRVLAKKLDAFATYCTLSAESATAPGQATLDEMIHLYRWPMIDSSTRVFGVIGDPVAHSMSPLLFNRWLADAGLNAVYLPLRLRGNGDSVRRFLDGCLARPWLDIGGFSVTAPHKADALRWVVKGADRMAGSIGAVNTLSFRASKVTGHNTDCYAAMSSLANALGCPRDDLAGLSFDLLGTGGVARAVLFGLRELGCAVTIYGRSPERTHRIADAYGSKAAGWEDRANRSGEVLINCTSVGMWPEVDESPMPAASLTGYRLVFDLVYNPVETRLIRDAVAAGSRTLSGLDMFVRQAAMQFALWTGKSPKTQAAAEMVRREIERRTATQL